MLQILLKCKGIFCGKIYIHVCVFHEILCVFHKNKIIFKAYKSYIVIHLKLLNSGDLKNPPLSSTPNDHKSLSMTRIKSPAHLVSRCLLMQPTPALHLFFFFWHFSEVWTCKRSLTGSIRNATSVFIHIARVAAPVLLWCWICYRKNRSGPSSMPTYKSSQFQREINHVNKQKEKPTTMKAKCILRICH